MGAWQQPHATEKQPLLSQNRDSRPQFHLFNPTMAASTAVRGCGTETRPIKTGEEGMKLSLSTDGLSAKETQESTANSVELRRLLRGFQR